MNGLLAYVRGNRNFWRRYRRTAFVTVGVLGSGYLLYKLYNARRHKVAVLERELAEREKFIKAQLREMKISCFIFLLKNHECCFHKYAFFGF